MDNILGQRIKERRNVKGFTQKTLAGLVGVETNTVWKWEKGTIKPGFESSKSIAAILDTTVAYLMGEADDPMRSLLTVAGENKEECAARDKTRAATGKEEPSICFKQASLEDFARARETSRNVKSLDEHDLNAAEAMLLASLEAIRKERAVRAAQQDGAAKYA